MNCDFCDVEIKNDGEGSAFCDGSAFSNVGIDERVSCAECCENIELEKEEQVSFLYKKDWGMDDD